MLTPVVVNTHAQLAGSSAHAHCSERRRVGSAGEGLPVLRHAQQRKHGEDRQNARRYVIILISDICFDILSLSCCCVLHCLISVVLRIVFVEELTELGQSEAVNRIWRLIAS